MPWPGTQSLQIFTARQFALESIPTVMLPALFTVIQLTNNEVRENKLVQIMNYMKRIFSHHIQSGKYYYLAKRSNNS